MMPWAWTCRIAVMYVCHVWQVHQRRVILGFEQSQPVQAGDDALRLGTQIGGRLGATTLKVGRRL